VRVAHSPYTCLIVSSLRHVAPLWTLQALEEAAKAVAKSRVSDRQERLEALALKISNMRRFAAAAAAVMGPSSEEEGGPEALVAAVTECQELLGSFTPGITVSGLVGGWQVGRQCVCFQALGIVRGTSALRETSCVCIALELA